MTAEHTHTQTRARTRSLSSHPSPIPIHTYMLIYAQLFRPFFVVCFLYIYRLNLIKGIFTNKKQTQLFTFSIYLYIYLYIYISTNISTFRSSDQSLGLSSQYLFPNFFSFFRLSSHPTLSIFTHAIKTVLKNLKSKS